MPAALVFSFSERSSAATAAAGSDGSGFMSR
jgi:hypothetical protein